MRKRTFRIETHATIEQAVRELLSKEPYTCMAEIVERSEVSYNTVKAWVDAEEEAGRLMVTQDGSGYRIEVVR